MTRDVRDGDARIARGLVREQHPARGVTDGVNRRRTGALPLVHDDKPLRIARSLRVLEPEVRCVRLAADGNEHTVERLLDRLPFDIHRHANAAAVLRERGDARLEPDFLEVLPRPREHRPHEVRVGSRENRVEGFRHSDPAAERGEHCAKLHANVATTDDQ